jgi:hypothetical protein
VKTTFVLALVVAVAALAATGRATPVSGGTSAVAVLKQEAVDLNARNWRPYYALMGPRFRAQCNFSTFVARTASVRRLITRATIEMISSRVAGSKAYLTYETVAPPIKPFVTKNDLFVRISGRWYDELDAVTTC